MIFFKTSNNLRELFSINIFPLDILTLIWVCFLGVGYAVGGGKIIPPV